MMAILRPVTWPEPSLRCVAGELAISMNNSRRSSHIPLRSHCVRQRPYWSAFISDSRERAQNLAGLCDSGSAGSATLTLYSPAPKARLTLSEGGHGVSRVTSEEGRKVKGFQSDWWRNTGCSIQSFLHPNFTNTSWTETNNILHTMKKVNTYGFVTCWSSIFYFFPRQHDS